MGKYGMKINEELVKYGAALAQRTKQADYGHGLGYGALAGLLAGGAHGYLAPGEETLYDDRGREIGKKPRDRMTTALLRALVGGVGGGAAGALLQHTGSAGSIKDKLKALVGSKSTDDELTVPDPNFRKVPNVTTPPKPQSSFAPVRDNSGKKPNSGSPRTAQSIGGKPQSYDEYRAAVGEEPSSAPPV